MGANVGRTKLVTLRGINTVPLDFHRFKHVLFRMADISSKAARLVVPKSSGKADEEEFIMQSPLSILLDDIFIQVVLPNMIDKNNWKGRGRKRIENAMADVYISQIVRHDSVQAMQTRPFKHLVSGSY